MTDSTRQILSEAVARNVGAILSIPATGPGETRRSRLLSEEAAGIWVESVPKQELLLDLLRKAGKPIGVNFRTGEHAVEFASQLLRREPVYRLSESATVDALLLAWPEEVTLAQRRSGYRVKLTLDAALKVRVWLLPADPKQDDFIEVPADLRDLSVCGMGVIFRPKGGTRIRFQERGSVRVEMISASQSMKVAGRLRYTPRLMNDGSLRAGIDFVGTDSTIEGRRTLAQVARLVAELQRIEARRRKAG